MCIFAGRGAGDAEVKRVFRTDLNAAAAVEAFPRGNAAAFCHVHEADDLLFRTHSEAVGAARAF